MVPQHVISQVRQALHRYQSASDALAPHLPSGPQSSGAAAKFVAGLFNMLPRVEIEQVLGQLLGKADPISRLMLSQIKDFTLPGSCIEAYTAAGWLDDLLLPLMECGDAEGLRRALAAAPRSGKYLLFVGAAARSSENLTTCFAAGLDAEHFVAAAEQIQSATPWSSGCLLTDLVQSIPEESFASLAAFAATDPARWARMERAEPNLAEALQRRRAQTTIASQVVEVPLWDAP